jgi:ABC-2 type transport system permease protein
MRAMLTSLLVEIRKLKGSLALTLCLVSPTLVATFLGLLCLRHKTMNWPEAMEGTTGLWSFFILPMSITALATLMAQIEHIPRAWDHVLSLPVSRWRLFTAKSIVIFAMVGLMSVLLALEIRLVDFLLHTLALGRAPTGPFPWAQAARTLGGMWAASLFMTMIQLWVSLRFHSFVPGLTLGVAGTFFAVMASGLPEGAYVPWMMPLNILAHDASRGVTALELGLIGGALTLLAMTVHLVRRGMPA